MMGVSTHSHTASGPDDHDVAFSTGVMHGEYLARLLATTAPERVAALTEGGEIRLRQFIVANLPADAPGNEIIESAVRGFHHALSTSSTKDSNDAF
jgi:hypothetical protein